MLIFIYPFISVGGILSKKILELPTHFKHITKTIFHTHDLILRLETLASPVSGHRLVYSGKLKTVVKKGFRGTHVLQRAFLVTQR